MSSSTKLYLLAVVVIPPILLVLFLEDVLAEGLVSGVVYALIYLPLAVFAATAARGSRQH